jgi:hypothetical protein
MEESNDRNKVSSFSVSARRSTSLLEDIADLDLHRCAGSLISFGMWRGSGTRRCRLVVMRLERRGFQTNSAA